MMRRVAATLAGLVGLAATLVGIPAGLYAATGNPIPHDWSWAALHQLLSAPATDETLFIHVVALIGWIAWALFAFSVLVELVSQLTGRRISIPGLRLPRLAAGLLAAPLVSAAVASEAVAAPPSTTSAVAPASTPAATATQSQQLGTPLAAAATAHDRNDDDVRDITYTVREGDSLMRIADRHYGDSSQWRRIAHANHDLVGEHGVNFLQVGWRLTLPDVPQHHDHHTADPRAGQDYEVAAGDTLSAIAKDAYGEPGQWRRIYHANQDQIDNPNLIDVGQDLNIPATHSRAEQSHRTGQDSHQATEHPDTRTTSPAAKPQPRQESQPGQAPSHRDQPSRPTTRPSQGPATTSASPHPTAPGATASAPARHQSTETGAPRTGGADRPAPPAEAPVDQTLASAVWAGPASALLAAGLLGVIAARRRNRAISRRPGRRLPGYTPEAAQAVTALRHVEAPLTVAHLDLALRTLSAGLHAAKLPLPRITAIRLDDDRLDCRLAEPAAAAPPKPFTASADGLVWTLPGDRADTLLDAAQANQIAAPYPALVTLGQDEAGAHVLVDLETIGALAVHTVPDEDAEAILSALAFELATSAWADDLHLTIAGACPELPAALGVDRARHVDHISQLIDDLEREAAETQHQLGEEGLTDAHQGRSEPDGADTWTPHILLIGHPLTEGEKQRLAAVLTALPRVAVAAVTTDTTQFTEWSLTSAGPAGTATVAPLNLTITPQRLTGDAYRAVCAALRQSQSTDTEPAPWWNHDQAAHRPDDTTDVERLDDQEEAAEPPTAAVLALPTVEKAAQPGVTDEEVPATDEADPNEDRAATQEPVSAAAAAAVNEHDQAAESRDAEGEPGAEAGQDDDNADTAVSVWEPADGGQLVTLHRPTLLLLGPIDLINVSGSVSAGRTSSELLEPITYVYLNPGKTTTDFRSAISGRTYSADELASRARRFLGASPDGSKLFPNARRDGGLRYYQLHPHVYSDWAHLQALIVGGVNTASTQHLTDALQLVRGRPLGSIAPDLWPWADAWREEATDVIVDIAHEVAERAIGRSDLGTARWAVQQGRLVDQVAESLGRLELRIERLAGNHSRVQRVAQRIIANARANNVQLDQETLDLLHQIRDGQRRRAQ